MLKLIAPDQPDLLASLADAFGDRATLVKGAAEPEPLLELARRIEPNVIIIGGGLTPPLRERALGRELRQALSGQPRLLLRVVGPTEQRSSFDLELYDGLISSVDPAVDLARIFGLGRVNRRRRIRARIPVALTSAAGHLGDGVAVDVSAGGAALYLHEKLRDPGPYWVTFHRPDGRLVQLRATPAWTEGDRGLRLGIRFIAASLEEVRGLYDLASWQVATQAGDVTLHLHGELSEVTCFERLLPWLPRISAIDLGDVDRVTSAGARCWMEALAHLPTDPSVTLRRVSKAFMRQLDIMPSLAKGCRIESAFWPFECVMCLAEHDLLVFHDQPMPDRDCPDCGAKLLELQPTLPGRQLERASS